MNVESNSASLRLPVMPRTVRTCFGEQRGWKCALSLIVLAAVSGCVQDSHVDGEHVFQYKFWVPLTALAAGVAAIPVGWLLRDYFARLGWGLVIFGPLVAAVLAPSLFRDRVVVNHQHFHVQTGIWGLTAIHTVEFSEIKEIVISSETKITRRGTRTSYYLNCKKKAGGSQRVPMNNAVTEAAAEAIFLEADAHGIPIRSETGGI